MIFISLGHVSTIYSTRNKTIYFIILFIIIEVVDLPNGKFWCRCLIGNRKVWFFVTLTLTPVSWKTHITQVGSKILNKLFLLDDIILTLFTLKTEMVPLSSGPNSSHKVTLSGKNIFWYLYLFYNKYYERQLSDELQRMAAESVFLD